MKWFTSRKTQPKKPAPVEGFSEKELTPLYNTGQIVKVESGKFLAKDAENDRRIFLVLKGALTVVGRNGAQPSSSDSFKDGDWIGDLVFGGQEKSSLPIMATESSSVLCINESAFDVLGHDLQNFILKKLYDAARSRMRKLEKSQAEIHSKCEYLSAHIRDKISQRDKDYHESELISNLFKNLPRLPVHTTNLIQLLSDGDASAREITRLAKQDPSLITEILKTVNSSYYGLHRPISDIQYAITYLGFNQVYQIVISSGLRKSLPDTNEFRAIHEHAVIVSNLVFEICQIHNRKIASTMSTIGLLHDIGKSIVLLMKMQNPKLAFFVNMLDSSKVGATLLDVWNIPKIACETIEYQNYPEFVRPSDLPCDEKNGVALLYIAHAACEYIQGVSDGILRNPFLPEYMDLLGFSGLTAADLVEKYIMIDLKLKVDTLPKHVRSFILSHLSDNMTSKAENGKGGSASVAMNAFSR